MTQEDDPTAIEPDETELTPKPTIENMPPEEGDPPPADDDELEVDPADYLTETRAADDPTVDDAETEQEPLLPGDAPD